MHLSGRHRRCDNWPSEFEKQKGKNEKQTQPKERKTNKTKELRPIKIDDCPDTAS
jgi:hypothetical protein